MRTEKESYAARDTARSLELSGVRHQEHSIAALKKAHHLLENLKKELDNMMFEGVCEEDICKVWEKNQSALQQVRC